MGRDDAERSKLRALVEGVEFRPIETDESPSAQTSALSRDIETGESA
jgi:hypothetical protein